ncbi:hypothetical protein SCP_0803590 [Sparassis crispa]|uniref:Uncharacterized protein n=1 Tax=Sparassis crispa TaxID=139825 RepID=A0A401GUD4_9APHY|nr:hypothetical protein SCP_0803590 [Sparassis crispa]GBE85837.1 hypothetical protein SCP_0803590 [Sparassis crispa]
MAAPTTHAEGLPSDMMHYTTRDNNIVEVPARAVREPLPDATETGALVDRHMEGKFYLDIEGASSVEEACAILKEDIEATRRLVCGVMQNQRDLLERVNEIQQKLGSQMKELFETNDGLVNLIVNAYQDSSVLETKLKKLLPMVVNLRTMVEELGNPAMAGTVLLPTIPVPRPPTLASCTGPFQALPNPSGKEINLIALFRTIGTSRSMDVKPNLQHEAVQAKAAAGRLSPPPSTSPEFPLPAIPTKPRPETGVDVDKPVRMPFTPQVQDVANAFCAMRSAVPVMLRNRENLESHLNAFVTNVKNMQDRIWFDQDGLVGHAASIGYSLRKTNVKMQHLEEHMSHLVPPEGLPEPYASEPQSEMCSVTIGLEYDKPVAEMSEEEAKAVLEKLPLTVIFDHRNVANSSSGEERSLASGAPAGPSIDDRGPAAASSSRTSEQAAVDSRPDAYSDHPREQSSGAAMAEARPSRSIKAKGKERADEPEEMRETAVKSQDVEIAGGVQNAAITGNSQNMETAGDVVTKDKKGKKRDREQVDEGGAKGEGRSTRKRRRKHGF